MSAYASLIVYLAPIFMWGYEVWRAHHAYPHMKLRDAIWTLRQREAMEERHCHEDRVLRLIAREHLRNKASHVHGGTRVP